MTEHPDRIERTLEVLLYAPIGVGLFLKETAPAFVDMFVSRGRAEIDRRHEEVQRRVTTARSLGQVALAFGPPIVRQRIERTVTDARRRAEALLGSPASESVPPRADTPPAASAAASPSTTGVPPSPTAAPETAGRISASGNGAFESSAELPIHGYDALSASQVVERLVGLAPEELEAVRAYETAHRQRRTILGKIEQLAG